MMVMATLGILMTVHDGGGDGDSYDNDDDDAYDDYSFDVHDYRNGDGGS